MIILKPGKWLLFIAIATVLSGAIILVTNNTKTTETKLDGQIKSLEKRVQDKNDQEVQQLKKQIEDLSSKVQAKAAEKARKESLASQVVNVVVPTAKAAEQPVNASYGGTCADWMVQAGVNDMANASELIRRESGCNPNATNRSSGAFGIPQALPASKIAYCGSDPVCQIKWMQDYVTRRYGSWANAVAFHNRMNWY